jgi:ligand-binding sensor domain-containing protein/signal transduction histidine kinase
MWTGKLTESRLAAILPLALAACSLRAEVSALSGFAVRNWDADTGLPQGAVRSVARSGDGYLWLAMSSGLARFDGARFTLLNTNQIPMLQSNGITALALSPTGELWVGDAGGGVVHRHDGRFEGVEPPLPRVGITAIAVAADGSLWIGTDGRGLFWMHAGRTDVITRSNGLPSDSIGQMVFDAKGKLWALVAQRLGWIENGKWQPAAGDPGPATPFYAIAPARDGSLWAGTASENPLLDRGGRVFRFVGGQPAEELNPYPWPFDSRRSHINAVLEDRQGRVWVGNSGAGVFCWTRGSGWRRVTAEGSLAQPEVTAFVEDGEGLLWLVSRRAELLRVSERLVTSMRLPPEAEENVINAACARRDGSVWIGTDGAGVFRWWQDSFTRLTNGLATLHVATLLEDSQTNLWVGTWKGLQRWEEDVFKDVPGVAALREVVLSLMEDSRHRIWASTGTGLVCVKPDGTTKRYAKNEGIDHTYIRGLAEDREGRICVAIMDRGLYRQQGGHFEKLGPERWPGATMIRAIHSDADGALWIVTFGEGLYQFKNERFRRWTKQDGLPDLRLHTIVEEGENLWISSDNGIFGCSRRALDSQPAGAGQPVLFRHLSTPEGMDTKVCSGSGQPVAAQTADGRLWFPNRRALAIFDPKSLPKVAQAWPVLIEEVLVNGEPVADVNPGHLRLESGARRVEFRYTSPNLKAPDRMRFRHRLNGFDEEWQEDGDRREATYTHLPPGQYTFQAMAGGPDGVWHQTPRAFGLEVVPRLYERRSVQVLGVLLLLGSGAASFWALGRVRLRRRLARIDAQQAMERERGRIARDLHDDLGAGLAEVVLLGELVREDEVPAGEMKSHVTEMTEKTRQLVAAMDEIVWTVNPRNDSVPNLVSYVAEHARKFFASAPMHCRLDIMEDLPSIPVPAAARHNLFLAVKEALHNVLKHSRASEVWLRMRWVAGGFTLEVQDDGDGFALNGSAHHGDGLENMRHRLESVGGHTLITSEPGRGTRVCFDLPVAEK